MSLSQFVTNDEMVSTGKDNQVTAFKMTDFQYTAMGKLILHRLLHDRDVKIVITSSGTTTGTGKTTLAIIIARQIHRLVKDLFDKNYEWDAKKQSFIDVWEYLEAYEKAQKGDILITDELEYLADRRRSMTHGNVYFSQAWAMLRYKNVITIGTAPGLSPLDKRIAENSDIWINVITQGRANSYYLRIDDFEYLLRRKRFKVQGFKESLLWGPLPENDPDYKYLKNTKRDIGVPGLDNETEEALTETDIEEAERDIKRNVAINLLEKQDELGLTQAEIGDIVGYSQQNIYKIKREEL